MKAPISRNIPDTLVELGLALGAAAGVGTAIVITGYIAKDAVDLIKEERKGSRRR